MDGNGELVNTLMEAHGEVIKLRNEVQVLTEKVAWYERQVAYIKMLVELRPD